MDDFDFTEEEIREQLKQLGYHNVSTQKLTEFKRDLENLVRHERSKNSSGWSTVSESGQSVVSEETDVKTYQMSSSQSYARPAESRVGITHSRSNRPFAPAPQATATYYAPPSSSRIQIQTPVTASSVRVDMSPLVPQEEGEESEVDTTLNSTASTERRAMRRKVMRKVDGESQVFDESSMTESEVADDVNELEARLGGLSTGYPQRPKTAPSGERRRIYGIPAPERPHTACSRQTPQFGVPDDYDGPKALIKPMTSHPHQRNIRRTDVVARGALYRQSWDTCRAPGEKQHKSLRWDVRENMLYHDKVVSKKQRVFVPNKYKIPSDKKRKNLRWQVRQDLAQGVVPPSLYE